MKNHLKWGMALLLAAGFWACSGDDGSVVGSDMELGGEPYCQVKESKSSVTQELYIPNELVAESGIKFSGENTVVFSKATFLKGYAEKVDSICDVMKWNKSYYDKGSFSCDEDGMSFTITTPSDPEENLAPSAASLKKECEEYVLEWKTESSSSKKSSSSRANSSSSERVSSSEKSSSSEEYSSSEKSSSSNAEYSSGTESSSSENSSSSVKSSSSTVNSSSDTDPSGRKKVVAKSWPMDCPEQETDDLSKYTIAYEFNDPSDLGKDFLDHHHAVAGESGVDGDCSNLILDGKSGLTIPLSDDFKTRGFILEARFAADDIGQMSNIVAMDPPGSGKDGWQLRLDGMSVRFHYRDVSVHSKWIVEELGTISLNTWHTAQVKIFPAKSEISGTVFYTMNLRLDGTLVKAVAFDNVDLSQLEYNAGIGYDAMQQGMHEKRYFVGKIDYIRYGKLSEDDL